MMQQPGVKKRLAVLVPGIMGSTLRYADERDEIWSSNFRRNYEMLVSDAAALSWSGKRAEASFMTTAFFSIILPIKKQHLWRATIQQLRRIPALRDNIEYYGYDWRASLIDTAAVFAAWLEQRTGTSVSVQRQEGSPGITFICHSMGGLLVRIAVGIGSIHPSWVFQMINIGSPLLGSPSAFRTAYDRAGLPGLSGLITVMRMKNSATYFESLRNAFTTFPSLFQLFPPATVPILYFGPQRSRKSPLNGQIIPAAMKHHANNAHDALRKANDLFSKAQTDIYVLYTDLLNAPRTEFEYIVDVVTAPNPNYIIRGAYATRSNGDGTVPEYSAASMDGGAKKRDVHQVEHSYLCNSDQVCTKLAGILR